LRLWGDAATGRPWLKPVAMLAGLLVFVLLRSIPYVGWVFGVLVTAAGLGSAWLSLRQAPEPVAAAEPSLPAESNVVAKRSPAKARA